MLCVSCLWACLLLGDCLQAASVCCPGLTGRGLHSGEKFLLCRLCCGFDHLSGTMFCWVFSQASIPSVCLWWGVGSGLSLWLLVRFLVLSVFRFVFLALWRISVVLWWLHSSLNMFFFFYFLCVFRFFVYLATLSPKLWLYLFILLRTVLFRITKCCLYTCMKTHNWFHIVCWERWPGRFDIKKS